MSWTRTSYASQTAAGAHAGPAPDDYVLHFVGGCWGGRFVDGVCEAEGGAGRGRAVLDLQYAVLGVGGFYLKLIKVDAKSVTL